MSKPFSEIPTGIQETIDRVTRICEPLAQTSQTMTNSLNNPIPSIYDSLILPSEQMRHQMEEFINSVHVPWESPVLDASISAINSTVLQSEKLIQATMPSATIQSEDLIRVTMPSAVWQSEKLIQATMPSATIQSEDLIRVTMPSAVWQSEKLIQTIFPKIQSLYFESEGFLRTAMPEMPPLLFRSNDFFQGMQEPAEDMVTALGSSYDPDFVETIDNQLNEIMQMLENHRNITVNESFSAEKSFIHYLISFLLIVMCWALPYAFSPSRETFILSTLGAIKDLYDLYSSID